MKNRLISRVVGSLLAVVVFVGSCLMPVGPADAGSGTVASLPMTRGNKLPSGIRATIDTRWTDGWGYRPVVVTFSVRKSSRDRRIRVDLYPESHSKFQKPLRVSTFVEIPEGQKKVVETIYVPQQTPWSTMRVEFFENRRKLKDISMEYGMGWAVNHGNSAPCVLMVDSDAPSISSGRSTLLSELKQARRKGGGVTRQLPDAEKFGYLNNSNFARGAFTMTVDDLNQAHRGDDYDSLQFVSQSQNLEMLPPADLPRSYIGLSGIDVIIISLDDLQEMSTSDVERFNAIDFYVRSGGNLITYAEQNATGRVDTLLNHLDEWQDVIKIAQFTDRIAQSFEELDDASSTIARNNVKAKVAQLPPTSLSAHGMGQIVAIRDADPYDQNVVYWQWVFRGIGLDRLSWPDRSGVSMIHENGDYWDFMIPGFGAAPVKRFLGVICMFIIVIGPMNFYVLNRSKRLYLLPITVGVAALFTTIGMFCYAMVSDGISTRVRLRSYTHLDQRQVEPVASTYSRQSYLAAIAPSDGLVFPDHAGIYPILPYYEDRQREEEIRPRTGKRVLGQGYLRSRSTTQFLVTDVQKTENSLAVVSTADGQIQEATNRIGVELTHAWVRDGNGKLFEAKKVADGDTLQLKEVDPKEAKQVLDKLLSDNAPRPPDGLDKNANRTMFGDLGSRRYYYRAGTPVYTANSLLEQHLKASNDFFRANQARPNSFLLVTQEVPPFVATGTTAKQEAGFHIVEGRW